MATVDLPGPLLGRWWRCKRMEAAILWLSRLRREAFAGASLNHPNLVSVYDILTLEDGHLVIVMEYVEGETLRELLTRRGALPPGRCPPASGRSCGRTRCDSRCWNRAPRREAVQHPAR